MLRTIAGRLESLRAVGLGEPQQSQTRPVALLGMRVAAQDLGDDTPRGRSRLFTPRDQP